MTPLEEVYGITCALKLAIQKVENEGMPVNAKRRFYKSIDQISTWALLNLADESLINDTQSHHVESKQT